MKNLILFFTLIISIAITSSTIASSSLSNNPYAGQNPDDLHDQLKSAMENGMKNEEKMIREVLDEINNDRITQPDLSDVDMPVYSKQNIPPYNPDWYGEDVLITSGDIGALGYGHRRTDMKVGKDGNIYVVLTRRPSAEFTGKIEFFRSSTGGEQWVYVGGIISQIAYFGQVSLLVENNTTGNADSTRLFVFYSRSPNSNFNSSTINWASFRRNGTSYIGGVSALTPTAGNRLEFPSAVSDGRYYDSGTYIAVVAAEYENGTNLCQRLLYGLSTNFGGSYTTFDINPGYTASLNDFYPSAAFKKSPALSGDTVMIMVERRSPVASAVTCFSVKFTSTNQTYTSRNLTPFQGYEKPVITIVQTAGNLHQEREIMIGYLNTINNVTNGYIRSSSDAGVTWTGATAFGNVNSTFVSYVTVSSDSNRANGGYIAVGYQLGIGDTIVVQKRTRTTVESSEVKVNEFRSSPFNSPVVCVYNHNGNNYPALAYTGLGAANSTSNVYFDSENLVSSITNTSTIAEDYKLEQNFPNPFNPTTTISFSIPSSSFVKLSVFDIAGREVSTLLNEKLSAGSFEYNFNASELPSGVYFYKLSTNEFSEVKRMMLVK